MGTFMLVFTVGCNVQSVNLDPKAQGVFVAVSIAASLMICIYALGEHPLQIMLHLHAVDTMEGVGAYASFCVGREQALQSLCHCIHPHEHDRLHRKRC
jgi:hypothetical protein